MANVLMNQKDEIIMKLVHYLITEQNYTPIVVNGVKDEIWLENINGPYRIVRINSNYIHNEEQYYFDVFKLKNIVKQIRKKTMSFSVKTLNILLDVNDDIEIKSEKNINAIKIDNLQDVQEKNILDNIFPNIKEKLIKNSDGLELVVNVTKEINEKTEKENKVYEKTFKQKKPVVTPVLIAINIVIFFLVNFVLGNDVLALTVYAPAIKAGEIHRLLTGAFVHISLWHLIFNMYALSIIGPQIESFVGKYKYIAIYLISAICGSLMSMAFSNLHSIGASGAIFGLMGSLVYFGYHYRLYLGQALRFQILPLILINLGLGILLPSIDMAAHVGGLIGGLFITMALGIEGKSKGDEKFHGAMLSIIFIAFLIVLGFIIKK